MAIYEEAKRADIAGWWEVGTDPHCGMYSDDAREAMDETNWDAFLSDLGGEDGDDRCDNPPSGDCLDGECDHSWALEYGTLFVREGSDAWDTWEDVQRSLANYPLLDDDAYSQREWDAWQEYVDSGWAYDLARHAERGPFVDGRWTYGPELRERIADDLIARGCQPWDDDENGTGWEDVDELAWVVQTWMGENVDAWAHLAMDQMSYWDGFTGECDDDTAVDVVASIVVGTWELLRMVAAAGHDWHVAAMGQARLPFGPIEGD